MRTHYDVLEVTPTASPEVIRGAYRYLAQKWHPDKHPTDVAEAQRRTQQINRAYEVLSDARQRASYDAFVASKRAAAAAPAPAQTVPDTSGGVQSAPQAPNAAVGKDPDAWVSAVDASQSLMGVALGATAALQLVPQQWRALAAIPVLCFSAYSASRGALALSKRIAPWTIAALIPGINVLALLLLYNAGIKALRKAGYTPGFFGGVKR
jgi:curved DNA-binding protein CbpA